MPTCRQVLNRSWHLYLYPLSLFPIPTRTKFALLVHLLPPGAQRLRFRFWRSTLRFLARTKMIGQNVRILLMVPTEIVGIQVITLLRSRVWSNVLLLLWP